MKPSLHRFRYTTRVGALVFLFSAMIGTYAQVTKGTAVPNTRGVKSFIPVLRKAYAAFNRADFKAAVASLDPQIEWTEPAEFPGGGTYHGRDAVKNYLEQSRSAWAEGNSQPEQFIVSDDRIVVFVHAKFRLKDSNQWQEVRLADVYTVYDGKIVKMMAFANRENALKWARTKK